MSWETNSVNFNLRAKRTARPSDKERGVGRCRLSRYVDHSHQVLGNVQVFSFHPSPPLPPPSTTLSVSVCGCANPGRIAFCFGGNSSRFRRQAGRVVGTGGINFIPLARFSEEFNTQSPSFFPFPPLNVSTPWT